MRCVQGVSSVPSGARRLKGVCCWCCWLLLRVDVRAASPPVVCTGPPGKVKVASTTLWVGSLSGNPDDRLRLRRAVHEIFEPFGPIDHVMIDQKCGWGFVRFLSRRAASNAMQKMYMHPFEGKFLKVNGSWLFPLAHEHHFLIASYRVDTSNVKASNVTVFS